MKKLAITISMATLLLAGVTGCGDNNPNDPIVDNNYGNDQGVTGQTVNQGDTGMFGGQGTTGRGTGLFGNQGTGQNGTGWFGGRNRGTGLFGGLGTGQNGQRGNGLFGGQGTTGQNGQMGQGAGFRGQNTTGILDDRFGERAGIIGGPDRPGTRLHGQTGAAGQNAGLYRQGGTTATPFGTQINGERRTQGAGNVTDQDHTITRYYNRQLGIETNMTGRTGGQR